MAQSWSDWCWQLRLASFLMMGGAIASSGDCAKAQITPDATLGAESSVVTPSVVINGITTNQIDGGAIRGANLFHSFEQFSIPTGGAAYFNNALNIQNIISRVTGESISNIDGALRANASANLFLLNPNGIIFGPNATLAIGGSFLGSTANSLNFADGTQFSATAPQTPPLLTISVPLGLQFEGNAGSIQVQGNGQGIRTTTDLIDTTGGLRVQPDQTLALVGGDVALTGGTLKTAGGRIELGSVAGPSLVSLTSADSGWALGYEGVPTFGDIQLSQQAAVDASGAGGGDIQVRGRRVTLSNVSQIEASTLGSEPGGTLTVRASELVELIGRSTDGQLATALAAQVYPEATGAGGNVILETGQLIVRDGAYVSAGTFGQGKGGNLAVTASDWVNLVGSGSGLFNQTQGAGSAGDLTIATRRLSVRDGAYISSGTFGLGKGGNLAVTDAESVELVGSSSGLFTQTVGAGDAGNLTIATRRLSVRDGAVVSAGTVDQGQGGNLAVTDAESVELVGSSSGLFTQTEGAGDAGNLTIATRQLSVRDGAVVSAGTVDQGQGGNLTVTASDEVELRGTSPDSQVASGLFTQTLGAGAAGDLTITTEQLLVQEGAQVSAGTLGEGQGGNLVVTASDEVELRGTSPDSQVASGLFTQSLGAGAAGDLTITTEQLLVQEGAQVSANTFDQGNGGNLRVNATNSVNLSGVGPGGFSSGLVTRTTGVGQGGNITVETSAFRIADGAVVDARTTAAGNGGNIIVKADTFEAVNGGQLLASGFRNSSGSAGNITVNTTDSVTISGSVPTSVKRFIRVAPNIIVENDDPTESGLFVLSRGSGNAGKLDVTARSISLDNQGKLTAETALGQGGDITLQAQDLLLLRRGSNISTTAGTEGAGGNGGNITINNTPFIVAVPSENSDITANAFEGAGGFIQITAQGVFGLERREQLTELSDITAFSQQNPELNGVVEINTLDIDPSRGLVNLPTQPTETEVVQACQSGGQQDRSEFVVTGRGGLPPNPSDSLNSDAVWIDLDSTTRRAENRPSSKEATQITNSTAQPLVEATGWAIDDKGQVVLLNSPSVETRGILSGCHIGG